MRLRVQVDGLAYSLDLQPEGNRDHFVVKGAHSASGAASVEEIAPGVYSVLLDHRSFTVYVSPGKENVEVIVANQRHLISIKDARDPVSKHRKVSASGPVTVHAQMPGRVVRLLVEVGQTVAADQGLIIIEAMKMQNELKSPKNGAVTTIHVTAGGAVAAGEALMIVE